MRYLVLRRQPGTPFDSELATSTLTRVQNHMGSDVAKATIRKVAFGASLVVDVNQLANQATIDAFARAGFGAHLSGKACAARKLAAKPLPAAAPVPIASFPALDMVPA